MAEAGRVIAGIARGTRLLAPGEGTRPLADRVKETLFAILEAGAVGPWPAPFLDLFAGSGAAGIEALSRGAPRATFVEHAPRALAALRENLRRAGLAGSARTVPGDVSAFLEGDVGESDGPYGAVVLDPPYGDATLITALERLGDPGRGWLRQEAVVVAKHFWRDALPERCGSLERMRERRFGETQLTFYRRTA